MYKVRYTDENDAPGRATSFYCQGTSSVLFDQGVETTILAKKKQNKFNRVS